MKKFLVLSSWSRKAIGSMLIMAFAVVGCDDSSSASTGSNEEPGVESSSSVEQGSSSSEKAKSSSSDTRSDANQSSSSEKTGKSSSSSKDIESSSSFESDGVSSSSVKSESSSSVKDSQSSSSNKTSESSSSSAVKVNCSALLEGETGWNWDVPKECRFNSDIDYGTMTDERDGKVYRTVKVGGQIWMAENLNYYDSTDLSVKYKSWCYGKSDNKDSSTCDVTGRLYTWAAAMDSVSTGCGYCKTCDLASAGSATLVQGICPKEWHLPSQAEWNALFTAVGGQSTAGKVLKSQTGWYNNGNGTDAFGFSALPAGKRYNVNFSDDGFEANFWSATEGNSYSVYFMNLNFNVEKAYLDNSTKNLEFSVRCVKD